MKRIDMSLYTCRDGYKVNQLGCVHTERLRLRKRRRKQLGCCWFLWNYSHLATQNIKGKFCVRFRNRSVGTGP